MFEWRTSQGLSSGAASDDQGYDADCVAAGAGELHIHPRAEDGRESLARVDPLMRGIRQVCPGTLVGVSTGAWIENNVDRTRDLISGWSVLPDYASVNLSEADAPAIITLLSQKGVGIEAGLATVADAKRFMILPECNKVFRVLFEIEEQDLDRAKAVLDGIVAVLEEAGIQRPILLHGFDATVWHFVDEAQARRWSTRVGLEDGCLLRDQTVAPSNASLVADAVALWR
jgi:uncharacterized protein (DUF849 family)